MSRIIILELLHHFSISYHIDLKLPGSVDAVVLGDRVVVCPRVNIFYKCSVPYICFIQIYVNLVVTYA